MIRYLPASALLLTLMGCGEAPSAAPQPTNLAAEDGGYLERLRALSDPQRNGVMLRAIRDAGHACQGVTESVASGSVDGAPAWTATCTDRAQWVVVINQAGMATVVNAAELAKAQGS